MERDYNNLSEAEKIQELCSAEYNALKKSAPREEQTPTPAAYVPKPKPLYVAFSEAIGALGRCMASGNTVWVERWENELETLGQLLPHGSGIDSGCNLLLDDSTEQKLVFQCDFHHMNENGYYDGWTYHKVTVTPEFGGFAIKISGRNRNDIKDYLGDVLHYALSEPVPYTKQPFPAQVRPESAADFTDPRDDTPGVTWAQGIPEFSC